MKTPTRFGRRLFSAPRILHPHRIVFRPRITLRRPIGLRQSI